MDNVLAALLGAIVGALATHFLEKSAREEERRENRRSRNALISVEAFALRRQLKSWIRQAQADARGLEEAQKWAFSVSQHFEVAERRASRIAAAAEDISSDRAGAARKAYVLFYTAAHNLNRAAAGEVIVWQPMDGSNQKVFARDGALDLVRAAVKDLESCVIELQKAIDPELLNAEATLPNSVSLTGTRFRETESGDTY